MKKKKKKKTQIERHYSRYFTISSLHLELPPTHTLKWPMGNHVKNHVQYTECSSHAICRVPLGTKGPLSY